MRFNTSKCTHIQLGKDNLNFTLTMNNTSIPKTNSLKHLGVYIQTNLK